jgi:hypothetical protein
MRTDRALVFKLGKYVAGQFFAKLYAPLIETINVPDDALGKDLMLIYSDQFAKGKGGHFFYQYGVGGAIATKDFVGKQFFDAGCRQSLLL